MGNQALIWADDNRPIAMRAAILNGWTDDEDLVYFDSGCIKAFSGMPLLIW
ncbi:MAG: hypothetical protein ACLQI7_02610 [Streptosporangiaceae bacterium]